jgi:hypothetical protein
VRRLRKQAAGGAARLGAIPSIRLAPQLAGGAAPAVRRSPGRKSRAGAAAAAAAAAASAAAGGGEAAAPAVEQ